ncbi:SRPBCC domain-containing protein [uncultured Nocardioides sp.]|uniref:SRPBCC domain-containing protein n=1 Tax=uncultured Nocardioides sp. TaxID=198441 RepID=UPI002626F8F9|nr:SRPBCC domain-containing protein [uncultured Nocardioides sp.]
MDPIRNAFVVDATPALAFEVFTLGMGSWWDRAYTPDPDSFDGIAIVPEVGPPVAMVHGDSPYPFGNVTVWEPGARYAQTFWLAMDPAHPSTLEVTFTGTDAGTRVEFEHGGWNDDNASYREKYGDWSLLLDRYRAAVAETG